METTMEKLHLMIDIETAGVPEKGRFDPIVLSIGLVLFDQDGTALKSTVMYPELGMQILKGAYSTESTIEWWHQQPPRVAYSAFSYDRRIPLPKVTHELNHYINEASGVYVKQSSFDIPILESLLAKADTTSTLKYWNVRDIRHIYDIAPEAKDVGGDEDRHTAMGDCLRQIKQLVYVYKKIGIW